MSTDNNCRLFPTDLPERRWVSFDADGFDAPVCGAIFRTAEPPCCGVPLGGLGTGCIDIDAKGVWGLSSIFNPVSPFHYAANMRMPRRLPDYQPILGLATGGQTWVLATADMIAGGKTLVCTDHLYDIPPTYSIFERDPVSNQDVVRLPKLEGVQPAHEIHYWGHYPVVDMEFETEGPIGVGLRAWAPFFPGDAAASNVPAAVFEARLRNRTSSPQTGTLALNFPGPTVQEAGATEFTRQPVEEDVAGVMVCSSAREVQYVLGVVGAGPGRVIRCGGGLNAQPGAWARLAEELPQPAFREQDGRKLYQDGSASIAVDFNLAGGAEVVIRFVLSWYAPHAEGGRKVWPGRDQVDENGRLRTRWIGSGWSGDTHFYTHLYAAHFGSALDVARRIAAEHETLLGRVLAWQKVVYAEQSLPVWLRDSLVNNLALLAEDSHWFLARPPLGDWAFPEGAFALNESPRGDPQVACIPCDWYGNLPVVFFFPELARSTLRAFKHYQREDGEIPFALGRLGDLPGMATPRYYWQVSLNGVCYIDLVDRLWRRTGDDRVLREFYDSARRVNTYTMGLSDKPGAPIRMPDIGGMEWFEHGEWAGMAAHSGGLRLAALRMVRRMAEAMGDVAHARQCDAWLDEGCRALEEELWVGEYYLNFYEPETGKRSDDVMAYQLDGEWAARCHGLAGVFRPDRVRTALETIKRCNVALTPEVGAANFARPDGRPVQPLADGGTSNVAWYGTYAMFPSEVLVLAMTCIYAGDRDFGLDLARRHWETLALRQKHAWDLPNHVRGDTGERVYGTDYSQDMMLWALPAALAGTDLAAPCQSGGLVARIIEAAKA